MAKVDNLDGLLKELCKPIESLDVIKNLQNNEFKKAAAGALALAAGVKEMLEENTDLVKRLGAMALLANLMVDVFKAYNEIAKEKRLSSSTYLNLAMIFKY
ncbi:hypothetical protein [Campylobacter geochelonis]|uniref:Uncharacterized protein n=1 Tax=Campylobacter geochelonis TaxID=1780362 RepID=A0A128ELT8_9BACT|nr:hypothetical protein [Campylobacter geochelonis]CZE49481.1 Uncharacterised protein [Campylobacter geochelonis]